MKPSSVRRSNFQSQKQACITVNLTEKSCSATNFSDRIDLFRFNTNNDPNFLSNIWARLKQVIDSFTDKQDELVDLLYLSRPGMTYEEAATAIGISFDSVCDREDGVILKMENEFKEFVTPSPYKDFHKNNIVIWSYIGCRHNPTAEKIHPCYRIRIQNGLSLGSLLPTVT